MAGPLVELVVNLLGPLTGALKALLAPRAEACERCRGAVSVVGPAAGAFRFTQRAEAGGVNVVYVFLLSPQAAPRPLCMGCARMVLGELSFPPGADRKP